MPEEMQTADRQALEAWDAVVHRSFADAVIPLKEKHVGRAQQAFNAWIKPNASFQDVMEEMNTVRPKDDPIKQESVVEYISQCICASANPPEGEWRQRLVSDAKVDENEMQKVAICVRELVLELVRAHGHARNLKLSDIRANILTVFGHDVEYYTIKTTAALMKHGVLRSSTAQ